MSPRKSPDPAPTPEPAPEPRLLRWIGDGAYHVFGFGMHDLWASAEDAARLIRSGLYAPHDAPPAPADAAPAAPESVASEPPPVV